LGAELSPFLLFSLFTVGHFVHRVWGGIVGKFHGFRDLQDGLFTPIKLQDKGEGFFKTFLKENFLGKPGLLSNLKGGASTKRRCVKNPPRRGRLLYWLRSTKTTQQGGFQGGF